jgi:hypothetical protein
MVSRCHNETSSSYPQYGGKGIEVVYEWRNWDNFCRDTIDEYTKHVSEYGFHDTQIDRIDNSKGYEPGNVRWVTESEQQQNRFQNKVVLIGEPKQKMQNKYYREMLKGDPNLVKP